MNKVFVDNSAPRYGPVHLVYDICEEAACSQCSALVQSD